VAKIEWKENWGMNSYICEIECGIMSRWPMWRIVWEMAIGCESEDEMGGGNKMAWNVDYRQVCIKW
jgi:hypothetical protein